MFTRLITNWPYKLLSLLVAIVIKWQVAESNHPHGQKRISIPVAITNLPGNLYLTNSTPDIDLVLTGPGSSLDSINPSSYRASVNLNGARAGANQTEKVQVDSSPGIPNDVTIDPSSLPAYATVTLEDIVKLKLHVSVTFNRIAPSGLSYGAAAVLPPVATVQGPASSLSRVVRLVVDGSDAVNSETITPGILDGFGPVIPLDASQNPVSGVTIMPNQAEVRIPVVRQAGVKEVLVNPVFSGRPVYPYEVVGVDVHPNAVTIQGAPDELGAYSVVKTAPIDISTGQDDITRTVTIYAPPGVASVSPPTASVTVHIRKAGAQ